jgi:hypothetical protein
MVTNADQLALKGLIGQLNELLGKLTAMSEESKSLNSAPDEEDWLAKRQAELFGYN